MSGSRPDPTAYAAQCLFEQELMGVVVLDRNGMIAERHGALVDWVETGRHWCDGLPALTKHQTAMDALALGELPRICLPGIHYRQADGRDLSFTVYGFPMPKPSSIALVFQDATRADQMARSILQQRNDLVLAEHRLTKAKGLADAANQAKSLFLANISHELRTPLNVIIGNAEILRDWDAAKQPAEELHTFAEDILENGTFLLDQINDLLDLAQAEAGGIKLAGEKVDIGGVIDDVLTVIRRQPDARAVALTHQTQPDLPRLYGDERRLRQVMHNLLCNAVQSAGDGGTVSIRSFLDAHGSPTVEISDDGVGIALDRPRDPLQPSGHAGAPGDNRTPSGSGAGLPLATTLVELHGGTLTLHSNPDGGTRITLRFPPDRARVGG